MTLQKYKTSFYFALFKRKALNFERIDIIASQELTIKLLTYTETGLDDLDLSIFSEEELEKFLRFISAKRKLEFYYTRLLWQEFRLNQPINYTSSGKPFIESGYLSISHSRNKIAIGYSRRFSIGLDIEHFNPKIYRIRSKFTSASEEKNFDLNDQHTLTTIWSIKEAIYKLVDISGLRFKEDICVLSIAESNLVEVAISVSKKHFQFYRISYNDFILTYCIS